MNYSMDRRVVLCHETQNSRLILACGIEHEMETECPYSYKNHFSDYSGQVVFSIDARQGKPIELTKYMAYKTS